MRCVHVCKHTCTSTCVHTRAHVFWMCSWKLPSYSDVSSSASTGQGPQRVAPDRRAPLHPSRPEHTHQVRGLTLTFHPRFGYISLKDPIEPRGAAVQQGQQPVTADTAPPHAGHTHESRQPVPRDGRRGGARGAVRKAGAPRAKPHGKSHP